MGGKRAIPSRREVVFVLIAFALLWLCLELGTLVYWWLGPQAPKHRMQPLYRDHPYRAFALTPHAIDRHRTASFNSVGFRGAEISKEKPPGTIRIACLGASTTFSIGATTDTSTYPARMEKLLLEHYRDTSLRLQVINAGVPASVSLESLINFQTSLLDFSPDIAIFHNGINEAWFMVDWPASRFESDYSHARCTLAFPPPKWWEYSPFLSARFARNSLRNPYFPANMAHLEAFVVSDWRAADLGQHGEIGRLEPRMVAAYERNLLSFVSTARGHDIIPVLSTQVFHHELARFIPWVQALERLNQASRDVAARESVVMIDFARLMPWNPAYFSDGCHLIDTPEGLGRKARIFADQLIHHGLIEQAAAKQRRAASEK